MPIIDWKKHYEIGVQQIDWHHRYLFSLLNTAYENFVRSTPDGDLSRFLNEFIDYIIYHFSAEEELMQEKRYPDLQIHQLQHDMFLQRIEGMKEEYLGGRGSLAMEILCFLANWLITHIPKSDAELGLFIAARQEEEPRDIKREGAFN